MKLAAEQAECTAPHGLHRSTRCKIIGLPSIRLTSCRATLQRGAVTARKAYMTPQSQFRYETGNAPADSACRLLVLMDHSLDFIELVSRRGVIEGVSGAIASLAGYEPKEIIGQHFHDLIHHADRAAADGAIAAVVALGRSDPVKVRYRCRDGSWRTVLASARNYLSDPATRDIVVLT